MRSSQLRVLFLLPSIRATSPVFGTLAFAQNLKRRHCDVIVGHLDDEQRGQPTIRPALDAADIPVHGFRCHGWGGLRSLRRLRAEIAAAGFDVVHSYGLRPDIVNAFAGHGAARLAFLREDFAQNYAADYGVAFGRLAARLELAALKRMEKVVVISDSIRRSIAVRGIPHGRVTVLPNLLNRERLDPAVRRSRSRPNGVLRLGCVSRLIPLKRVDWVIQAVAELMEQKGTRGVTLDVVGDGPLRSRLEGLAQDLNLTNVVRFRGHIDDMNAFLRDVDVHVLASSSEGVPRSVMEAMYVGITCIAPRVGGVEEIIDNGRTGFLFDATSYDDLVAVLRRVVNSVPLDPEQIGRSIEAYSNDDKAAELLMRTYEEVVNNRRLTQRNA